MVSSQDRKDGCVTHDTHYTVNAQEIISVLSLAATSQNSVHRAAPLWPHWHPAAGPRRRRAPGCATTGDSSPNTTNLMLTPL